MNSLLGIALAAARFGVAHRGAQAARRLPSLLIAYVIVLFFLASALIWFESALWYYLIPLVRPAAAAAIVGAVLVVVALAILVAVKLSKPRRRLPPPAPPIRPEQAVREVERFVRHHKGTLFTLAAVAGLVLSASMRSKR